MKKKLNNCLVSHNHNKTMIKKKILIGGDIKVDNNDITNSIDEKHR